MQLIRYLEKWLDNHANSEHYIFTLQDFRSLFSELSEGAFKTLMSRAAQSKILEKVCRNIYVYKPQSYSNGRLIFHIASYLRSSEFNYISLESALSDIGVISQIPMNTVTIMSSGRSSLINCHDFGIIEFIHTNQKPENVMNHLTYDRNFRLWRADVFLAVRDMKMTRHNCDLLDKGVLNELI